LAHGLLRVPQKNPTFPRSGNVVLRWRSAVSEPPVPAGADQCFPARQIWIMASAELNIVHYGRGDVDLQTPEVYPAGPRPDVRLSARLEEGQSDRGAGHRRAGYPSDFGMSAASRRRPHMGTDQGTSRSATYRNPDHHRAVQTHCLCREECPDRP